MYTASDLDEMYGTNAQAQRNEEWRQALRDETARTAASHNALREIRDREKLDQLNASREKQNTIEQAIAATDPETGRLSDGQIRYLNESRGIDPNSGDIQNGQIMEGGYGRNGSYGFVMASVDPNGNVSYTPYEFSRNDLYGMASNRPDLFDQSQVEAMGKAIQDADHSYLADGRLAGLTNKYKAAMDKRNGDIAYAQQMLAGKGGMTELDRAKIRNYDSATKENEAQAAFYRARANGDIGTGRGTSRGAGGAGEFKFNNDQYSAMGSQISEWEQQYEKIPDKDSTPAKQMRGMIDKYKEFRAAYAFMGMPSGDGQGSSNPDQTEKPKTVLGVLGGDKPKTENPAQPAPTEKQKPTPPPAKKQGEKIAQKKADDNEPKVRTESDSAEDPKSEVEEEIARRIAEEKGRHEKAVKVNPKDKQLSDEEIRRSVIRDREQSATKFIGEGLAKYQDTIAKNPNLISDAQEKARQARGGVNRGRIADAQKSADDAVENERVKYWERFYDKKRPKPADTDASSFKPYEPTKEDLEASKATYESTLETPKEKENKEAGRYSVRDGKYVYPEIEEKYQKFKKFAGDRIKNDAEGRRMFREYERQARNKGWQDML